jgi:hypothetical protein
MNRPQNAIASQLIPWQFGTGCAPCGSKKFYVKWNFLELTAVPISLLAPEMALES